MSVRLSGLLLLGALVVAGCGTGGLSEGGNTSSGKRLFTEKCASCHTLGDARTAGTIGPNLDDAFASVRSQGIDESTIREVVSKQMRYPLPEATSPAVPAMPADLLTGEDADSVAAYVASVAGTGKRTATPPPAGGGGKADGKSIFASFGCGSCHTFEAAGATGTIGPNLDESKPSVALAIERVTNGMGAMPSFKDRLTAEQIRAVAEYVAAAGG